MKTYKRLMSLVIALALIMGIIPMSAITVLAEISYSGQCGENAYWELDRFTGTLTISGTGSIEKKAFAGHTNVRSVVIIDGLEQIEESAFWGCSLRSISIPNSVTSIGESAFEFCENLTSISIPDGVTSIGGFAFYSCDSLLSVTIGNGVTRVSECAFARCSTLASVTIGDSVTHIERHAFEFCEKLTSFSIPNSVVSIETQAFVACNSITAITIPHNVTSIDDMAFCSCLNLMSITVEKGNPVYHSDGNCIIETAKKEILLGCNNSTIPSDGSVTSIGQNAFWGCVNLVSITIPNTVTRIGSMAFYNCTSLTSITIPPSVTYMGYRAFDDCTNLTSVIVDDNNKQYSSLDGVLFNKTKTELCYYPEGKTSLSYNIPDGVTYIWHYAFESCDNLNTITIPYSVTNIGESAFDSCGSLTSFTVANNNSYYCSLDGVLFDKDKTQLIYYPLGNRRTSYIIPDSVTNIWSRTFLNCNSLKAIVFPCGVMNIGEYAVYSDIAIYGNYNSAAHKYALEHGNPFYDITKPSVKYTEDTLNLYYPFNKNNIELGDAAHVGADYIRGNSLGMLYDGDMRWELSNPEVLQIESYSTKAALLYFKAVGLGSCDITLYLDGKKAVSDTVTVKVSDKTLLENNSEYVFNSSAFSTLEAARNTCKEIIDGNNGIHRSLASFFESVENGLGVGVITKEALAAAGLTTSMAEDAEDKAVEKIMVELIGAEDPAGSATGKIEKAYKVIKTGYSTATVNKDRFFDTIVNVFDYSYEQAEELYNKVDDYKSKTDIAFDVLDVTLSAMLISQFEMDTIKDMRDATSYGSALYLSLNRLYEKRADLVAYATDRFLNEQAIGKLNELIGKLGGPTYKIANLIGTWSKLIYDCLGGLDAEDYLVAQNNWGFAGYFYNYSLKVNGTPENFERYYKYYIAAVKAALKSAVDISRDYRLTNIADGLYEQIELTCHYEDYFDQVRNDLNNVCSVSKKTFENDKVLACHGGGIASYSLRNTALIANEEATADNFYNNIDPEKIISIPAYIDGSRIEGVADYGFAGLMNIQGFMLPQTIETIGEYAFSNCSNAKFVHLNSGITEIGEGAFANCAQLEVLNLPETLQSVGYTAFANCSSLGSIAFGKNVTMVGAKALKGCTNLKTVIFNNAGTIIAQDAFENCEGITVYGYEGSTAQTLADNCGFTFVAFEDAVAEMRIITPAAQQSIVAGEAVSTDGMTIEVLYMDGTKEIIDSGWSIVCDTTSVGVQQVNICYKDGSVSYPITVTKKVVEEITLSDQELSLFITDSYQLIVDCEINHALDDLIWSSDNEEIVKVNESGYVTALKVGSANITVSLKDGSVSDCCKITVVNNERLVATEGHTQSQIFSPAKSGYYTFYSTGSSANIIAILYNTNGEIISASSGRNVGISTWLVDDEAYYVEIQTAEDNALTLEVSESTKAESIKISMDDFCDKIGGEHQLEVNYEPLNSLREELVWNSSNEEIVSVDQSGLIKLHKEGSAVITVTSENGLIDTLEVTVDGYPIITTAEGKTVSVDQNVPYAYFQFTPIEDGYYSFYSYDNDHDTYGYILNSDMEEITSDDDGGDGNNFKVRYQLEAGVTYVLKARFLNTENSGSFKVCVEQTKYVTALEIVSTPERTEYVEGFVNADNINYYGLKLKVTWSDGTTTDWKYNYDWSVDGEYIYRDASNIDETGNVELTCGEATVTLTLTIIENPVDHLELISGTSRDYIENYNGYTNFDGNFIYYTNHPNDAVIKIVYTDGASVTAKVGEHVEDYYVSWNDDQYNQPWVVGTENKSTISYLGHTVNLPITVEKNKVSSIEVVCGKVICVENTYGYDMGDGDYYYYYDVPSDVAVKINYVNGTSKTVKINDMVDGYTFSWNSDQYETPWVLGDDNYLTLSYLGVTTQLPVSVIANPVERIVINSAPTREYVYGDTEYGYLYLDGDYEFYPTDLTGLSFTVYYTDGTNKTFTYDDIDDNGNINGYGCELNYDEYSPEIGNFPVTFEYMGRTADYTVVLKESNVASIAITKAPLKTDYYDSWYYSPDFIGMELIITYTDGSTKAVALTEENLVYDYSPWGEELCYKADVNGYALRIEPHYTDDGVLYYAVHYLGKSCAIEDITFTEGKEISSVELGNVSWNGDGMIVKVTYTDETTEIMTIDIATLYDFEDSSVAGFGKTKNGLLYYYIETYALEDANVKKYMVYIFGEEINVESEIGVRGDIDGDGILGATDVTMLRKALLGIVEVDESNPGVYDANSDGTFDIRDLICLKKLIANPPVNYGDANRDGSVNAADLVVLRTVMLGNTSDDKTQSACDVNADGEVNILDLIRLKKYLAGEDVVLGPTESVD